VDRRRRTCRTYLVGFDQPALADHIGREGCSEAAVHPIWRSSLMAFSLVGQSYQPLPEPGSGTIWLDKVSPRLRPGGAGTTGNAA
jgi:hypothetical protein